MKIDGRRVGVEVTRTMQPRSAFPARRALPNSCHGPHSEALGGRPATAQPRISSHFWMRMRGLEPPPDFSDTDLNRARLPIPPHPRAAGKRRYRTDRGRAGRCASLGPRRTLAAIVQGTRTPPSHGGNPGSNPGSGMHPGRGISLSFSLSQTHSLPRVSLPSQWDLSHVGPSSS